MQCTPNEEIDDLCEQTGNHVLNPGRRWEQLKIFFPSAYVSKDIKNSSCETLTQFPFFDSDLRHPISHVIA